MMQRDKVQIQPACLAQLKEIAAIARQSFPDPWSEQLFANAFSEPNTEIWCAMKGDQPAGYLVLQQLGDEMSVDDLAVAPDFRRMQIGTRLLKAAQEKFSDRSFILEVREHNAAAIALYRKLGYEQVGYRKRYYLNPPEAAVLMRRAAVNSSV